MTKAEESKATAAAKPKKARQKTCFVIGPIGNENSEIRDKADLLMDLVIGPALEGQGYEVERADDIPTPGMIDSQVINKVLDADLVIADLTGHNPNAFYELGLRHAAAQPVIHIFEADSEIPFDIQAYRAVPYSLARPAAYKKAGAELKKQIEAVNRENYTVDNPVVRARGRQEYRETLPEPQKGMFDMIESVSRRMGVLERNQESNQRRPDISRQMYHVTPNGHIDMKYSGQPSLRERQEIIASIEGITAAFSFRVECVAKDDQKMTIVILGAKNIGEVRWFHEWLDMQPWAEHVMSTFFKGS